ncbi:MAG TPA: nickel pincer cofactor biosynthesis protein LarB [Dehalococcoidia bacterium]|nr:nickel pincer cofactor biosynthesis protein LarB [Dehalococcoidia bacterium]
MRASDLRQRLEALQAGDQTVDQVLQVLRDLPYQDLGFAKLDHHRPLRTGSPEVVLGRGKTPEQVSSIVAALMGRGHAVLVTKTDQPTFQKVALLTPQAVYNSLAGAIVVPGTVPQDLRGGVLVVTAGTADLPVAEEAALTAELMGSQVARLSDVGVAGLHRLLDNLPALQQAQVIVVVAGMEAALTGVVAGLVSVPVVAVPTSVGYGASFEGLAALLGMLNSCAPGVAVVNIDNGFGAGYLAAQINQREQPHGV